MDNPTSTHFVADETSHHLGQINEVIYDVMRLASYAIETGRLPEEVSLSALYRIWEIRIELQQSLTANDIDLLQHYFHLLKTDLEPVSAISLRATESKFGNDSMQTEAGKHVRRMWITAFSVLSLILMINIFQYSFEFYGGQMAQSMGEGFSLMSIAYWVAMAIAPFAYGALGASVRLLRVTEQKLRDRSFDPRRLPEHRNRLVLGMLSGGVLVMLYSSGGVGDTSVKLTEVTLGFIAGYSIDVLFSVLDGMVAALTPNSGRAQNVTVKSKPGTGTRPDPRNMPLKADAQQIKTIVDEGIKAASSPVAKKPAFGKTATADVNSSATG